MDRIGIIDIGSNSVRLVIYEQTEQLAYRVIDESKESARLSEHIQEDGSLELHAVSGLVDILNHFKKLCRVHRVRKIRAVATAAIRNAANRDRVLRILHAESGLDIEVLSGEEEAKYGFWGTINTIEIRDGFLIDIGGGSTEITLFRDREIVNSVSFPFGSVNTTRRYSSGGLVDPDQTAAIHHLVDKAMEQEPWLSAHPGLPLIGLGGTARAIGKLIQKIRNYPLPLAHRFTMDVREIEPVLHKLVPMPVEKRKKIEGLSKNRADIIVPGMILLTRICQNIGATRFIVSGSGLRDGLYYETISPHRPKIDDVLEHSIRNLLALHPGMPLKHLEQVNRIALQLFDDLREYHKRDQRARTYLHVASLLYRIGISVHYYNYDKHTFYLMAHSRINGLTHREILLCALIASYKSRKRTRQMFNLYKDVLDKNDLELVFELGTLMQLAVALDRSGTQPVGRVQAVVRQSLLLLLVESRHSCSIEEREVGAVEKDFLKVWKLRPKLKRLPRPEVFRADA